MRTAVMLGLTLSAVPSYGHLYATYKGGSIFEEPEKIKPIFLNLLPTLEELMKPNFYVVSYL